MPTIKHIFSSSTQWLIHVLYFQLALVALSFPLLLLWGLPFSLTGIAGNILFTPFLTMYLFLCSLIVICEIARIPSGFFSWMLTHVHNFWVWLLSFLPNDVVIACCLPPTFIIIVLFIVPLLIIHFHNSKQALTKKTLCLALTLHLATVIFALNAYARGRNCSIEHEGTSIVTIKTNDRMLCIDRGNTKKGSGLVSWYQYTFLNDVRKNCGRTIPDTIIFLKPTAAIFETAQLLAQAGSQHFIIPDLKNPTPALKNALELFFSWALTHGHTITTVSDGEYIELSTCIIKGEGEITRTATCSQTRLIVSHNKKTFTPTQSLAQFTRTILSSSSNPPITP